ncbi:MULTISPECIES: NADPH-dependent FMN reductase [Actinomadura]|uniref:NADPH-dependent FMN reductase n=1 Tax=Actinomadura yumaensis TaxID=111807 RepID=A0ABW2CIS0_9ACTN|nr:NAD(P)H-dependent oxidoreductase [Actinomadura sp. J1-007]MWK38575.1 FMN reductase [Actinomadura sp. J1-007]
MDDITVLAISGSLRTTSYNTALARAARKQAPPGVRVSLYNGLREIPPFDQDQEERLPAPVTDLRRRIGEADALLLCTPEYNHSYPGVLKNAIDWASRPPGRSVLNGKLIAIAGASPGFLGTARAQVALRAVFVGLNAEVVTSPEVAVFRAQERFDQAGNLTDETSIALLQQLLTELSTRARR